jgi:hypothetical protein
MVCHKGAYEISNEPPLFLIFLHYRPIMTFMGIDLKGSIFNEKKGEVKMDYKAAFTKLYGSAGAALDYLMEAKMEAQEHSKAIEELKGAIAAVEAMIDESEET